MSELTLTHFFTYYDVGSRHVLTAELRPVLTKFAFILFSREVPCFQQYISKYHLDLVQFTKILNIFLVICGLHMSFGIPQKLLSGLQFAPSVRKLSNLSFLFSSYWRTNFELSVDMHDRTKKRLNIFLACLFLAIKIVKIFAFVPNEIKLLNVKKAYIRFFTSFLMCIYFLTKGINCC